MRWSKENGIAIMTVLGCNWSSDNMSEVESSGNSGWPWVTETVESKTAYKEGTLYFDWGGIYPMDSLCKIWISSLVIITMLTFLNSLCNFIASCRVILNRCPIRVNYVC